MLRQCDETDHARLRLLVNEFAKAQKVHRPRRAGIDRRGHAGGEAERIEIAAVGIHSPVTVHVEVDQARRHVATRHIDDALRPGARNFRLNRRDPIARDCDIQFLVQSWSPD